MTHLLLEEERYGHAVFAKIPQIYLIVDYKSSNFIYMTLSGRKNELFRPNWRKKDEKTPKIDLLRALIRDRN